MVNPNSKLFGRVGCVEWCMSIYLKKKYLIRFYIRLGITTPGPLVWVICAEEEYHK